jgi:hypothetical protein
VRGFTTQLCAKVPELFNSNGLHSFTKKYFAKKYDSCYLGMNPKQIKLPRDCSKEEFEKCFGLVVNKHEHQYKSI